MFDPFFDPSNLNSNQLMDKMSELQKRINYLETMHENSYLKNQLKSYLEACQAEFEERNYMEEIKQESEEDNSFVIGEDDFKPKNDKKEQKKKK